MVQDRTRLSDEGDGHERHDPDESDLEIDAANDSMGGPTTASLSSGLPSALEEEDADSGGCNI